MKKLLMIAIGVLCLLFAACGNNNMDSNENNKVKTEENNSQQKTQKEKATEKEIESEILNGTYNVPLENIYVDIPNEFQGYTYKNVGSGKTEIWNIGYELNICFTADYDVTVTSLEEADETSFERYKFGVNSYIQIAELLIEKEEIMEVNGVQVYRFEGQLIGDCGNTGTDDSGDESLYTVGYSFIMDGIPCRIQGMVLCEDENCSVLKEHSIELMEQEVCETVDAMIQTLRTEP